MLELVSAAVKATIGLVTIFIYFRTLSERSMLMDTVRTGISVCLDDFCCFVSNDSEGGYIYLAATIWISWSSLRLLCFKIPSLMWSENQFTYLTHL